MSMISSSEQRQLPSVRTLVLAAMFLLPALVVAASVSFTKDLFVGLVAASVIGTVAVILVRPQTATLFFFYLTYVNAPVVAVHFHGVPAALAAATVGLLLIPAIQYIVCERKPIYLDRTLPWLLGFCVVQFVSTLLAADKISAMEAVVVYLSEGLLLFLLVTNSVRSPEVLRQVTWILVAAGVFMGGLVAYQKVSGTYWRDYKGFAQVSDPEVNAYGEHDGGRWPSGPIGDKNYFAQFMLMLFPLSLFRYWNEPTRRLRWAGLFASVVILAGVGLTGSRGAAIGFAVTLLVMVALRYVTWRQVIVLAVMSSMLIVALPEFRHRVASIASVVTALRGEDVRETDTAVQGRLTEMAAALLVFCEHPLMGVGPGNFPSYFVEKADLLGFTVHGEERRAHCMYLEIAAETGVLGLIVFLLILGMTIKNLFHAHAVTTSKLMKSMTAAYLLAMVAMVATGMFLSFAYVRYCWLVIGLSTVAAQLALQSSDTQPSAAGVLTTGSVATEVPA